MVGANVFGPQLIRGLGKVAGKVRDGSQIKLYRVWREPPEIEILQYALT